MTRYPVLLGSCLAAAVALRAGDAPRAWPPDAFRPVTLGRIAALPAAEQPAWRKYWEQSQAALQALPVSTIPEFSPLQPLDHPLEGAVRVTHGLRLNAPAGWYASAAACVIADRVVAWQSAAGGWTKGIPYDDPRAGPAGAQRDLWSRGTFDNDATLYELQFLARVLAAGGGNPDAARWRVCFLKGLRYVFAAQYPNGGFPQVYPLAGGYHDAITFNDDAMVHALEFLQAVAAGQRGYDWLPADVRVEAGQRLARGLDCVLATQLRTRTGALTAWCQQYDALTLQPCAARNFEPVATCTRESIALLEFLMAQPQRTPAVTAAVEGAAAWLRRVALRDLVWRHNAAGAHELRPAPGAPLLWARFYELETDRPIFGDRDRTIHYAVEEISSERRDGYAWYGEWPAACLAHYEQWKR